jgi:UDP-4-amino-4,6-dideoxy-N-acetyl-beta-L-altrosamine transaminase
LDYIPYGRQDISEADIQAVVEVLRGDYLTQGPAVPAFEQAVARYCDARHAVASNSGTSALHLACLALDVGPGDVVWTSAITFVASANCARYCGAEADFVDIDPRTCNVDIAALKAKLEGAARAGRLPKALVPVHLGGLPCDMAAIAALAKQYDVRVVEDASHALGSTYRGERVGNCRYSDITVLSFHPVKLITSGEGGMNLTNDPVLARRLALLRSHGITRETGEMTQPSEGPWYYQQTALGFNYRMTDIHAALGRSQLDRLQTYIERREALAKRYDRLLAGSGLRLPAREKESTSAWHLYIVGWNSERSGLSRAQAFARLREAGIGANVHYIPVHLQPYYRARGCRPGLAPNAEAYYASAITLPLHARMTDAQQDHVVATLRGMLDR